MELRKDLARSILAGHPWIYRDAIRDPGELPDGAVVIVTTARGRALGRGFWSRATPIAVRMLTLDKGDDLATLLRARLVAALERRLSFIDRQRTNAFRWVHGEADQLPGIHLDVYATAGAIRFDGEGARAFYLDQHDLGRVVMEVGARVELAGLVERRRGPRGQGGGAAAAEGTGGTERAEDHGEAVTLAGARPAGELEVREEGLAFGVDLVHGQKGGLFLDQRDNRVRVATLARGRRVLNLFGYTGGFSVHAAAGGAAATTTVDLSPGAVAAAARNFERNGFSAGPPPHQNEVVVADAFAFLEAAALRGRRWDLVISDPPSFAPSQKALPAALAAYGRLHRLCAAVVEPGGLLCPASCSSHVGAAAFLATVEEGCRQARRRFAWIEDGGAGADHPVADFFPEGRYLKLVLGTVT